MTQDDVAHYLKEHPEFFDEHSEFLSALQVPNPHGGRAIPLAERQLLSLREENRLLKGKLREFVQFGEENDTTSDRVHRVTLALLAAPNLAALFDSLYSNLREDFRVPAIAIRVWSGESSERVELSAISPEVRVFAESLTEPYFSDHPMFDTATWFEAEAAGLHSLVYLPLRAAQPFGLLAFGSDDAQRFTADQGTLYLRRLGELVSMALQRWRGA